MNQPTDIFDLVELLKDKKLTLSLAESCTGGLIGSVITSMPGSSTYFMGSAVTYSNQAKEDILGVSHDTLIKYGAVSEETAKEMAIGSKRIYKSDVAASVTGVAGPDGGSDEKPVGMVCIAVTDGNITVSSVNRFSGDRDEIRNASCEAVIRDILKLLES